MEPTETTPAVEPTTAGLTRFYVLRASEDLLTFTLVGFQQARDRDHALRLQFNGYPRFPAVAVSEHAFRVRKPRYEAVARGFQDVELPDPGSVLDALPENIELDLEIGAELLDAEVAAEVEESETVA